MKNFIDALMKEKSHVRTAIYILAALFAALLIFEVGMFAGERRAVFSYGTGDAYYRVFDHARGGPLPHDEFIEAHGAAGKIISLNLPKFVVADSDNTEKVVIVGDDTQIRKFRVNATSTDLNVNDFVVVIGEPNDHAEVAAKLIRILPPPQQQ